MHAFPIENLFVSLMLVNNTFFNCTNTTSSNDTLARGKESANSRTSSYQMPTSITDCEGLTNDSSTLSKVNTESFEMKICTTEQCTPRTKCTTEKFTKRTTCTTQCTPRTTCTTPRGPKTTCTTPCTPKTTCTTKCTPTTECTPKKTVTTSVSKTSTLCDNSKLSSPLGGNATTCTTQGPPNSTPTPSKKCEPQELRPTPAAYIIKSYGIHGRSGAGDEKLRRNQTDNLRLLHEILCIPKHNKSHLSSGPSELQKLPRINKWDHKEMSFPVMSSQDRHLVVFPQTKINQINRANQKKSPGPLLIHVLKKYKAPNNAPETEVQQMPQIQTIRVPDEIQDDDLESIVKSIKAQLNIQKSSDTWNSDRVQTPKNLACVMTIHPRNVKSLRSLPGRFKSDNSLPNFPENMVYRLREPSLEVNRDSRRKQFVTGINPFNQQRAKVLKGPHFSS